MEKVICRVYWGSRSIPQTETIVPDGTSKDLVMDQVMRENEIPYKEWAFKLIQGIQIFSRTPIE